MITQERLKEVLYYNEETGVFTWQKKIAKKIIVGQVAGCDRGDGYIVIRIYGHMYFAHRLAWLYMTGEWPTIIDHKRGLSNRWKNLRDVTTTINMQNRVLANKGSTSGLLGAHKKRNKFASAIRVNGRNIKLGVFNTAQEAHESYMKAKKELHQGFVQ